MSTLTTVILFYCICAICGFVFPRLFRKFSFYWTAAAALAGMVGVWIMFLFSFGPLTDTLLLVFQMGSLGLFFASAASGFRSKALSDRKSA